MNHQTLFSRCRRQLIGMCLVALAPLALAADDQVRAPSDAAELRYWLENMLCHHRYSMEEMHAVTGLDDAQLLVAIDKFGLRPEQPRPRDASAALLVLPYPGGRHPRIGFLDGAIAPQRETKLSIFPPWENGGYVVLDVPEALWSNLGLTYLAHRHIDTIWTKQGITLPPREWERHADGSFKAERALPNGIAFGVEAKPARDHVGLRMWLRNGTAEPLSDLRVQMCAMLRGAEGFQAQSNENKIFEKPFAACRDASGKRWIIHAWEPIHRVWGNAPCPCLHADPKFPDCPPGETRELSGWLSFFEGDDVRAEMQRIARVWPGSRNQER